MVCGWVKRKGSSSGNSGRRVRAAAEVVEGAVVAVVVGDGSGVVSGDL